MKKILISILFLCLFSSFLEARDFNGKEENAPFFENPDKKFKANESLNYSVEWLGIPVGKINLHVEGVINVNGGEDYLVAAHAEPNSFFKKFYDFEYNINSLIDSRTFLSQRFEKARRIGKNSILEVIDFNRANNAVHYRIENNAPRPDLSFEKIKLQQDIPQTYELAPGAQDLFSALYYFRIADIKPGEHLKLNIYYALRNWQVDVYISQPFILNLRKKGSFVVFKVKLSSGLNSFVLGKKDMDVIFTADSRRIPVIFRFGSGIGTFRGVLEELPK